ncbi:hypothetical protein [Paraglaciecola arctica]|nr:hypothetical protein [Paraglaciecola arctica]
MKFLNRVLNNKLFINFCLLIALGQAHATVISLETSTMSPVNGDNFVIELWIRELGNEPLSNFDFDIAFDESLVQLGDVTFGPLLGDGIDSFQDSILSTNSINLAEWSLLSGSELDSLQNDIAGRLDFMLVSLTFAAIAEGVASFALSFDPINGGLFDANADSISFTIPTAQLAMNIQPKLASQVSEPNTLGLFASLLCIVLAVRSQGRSQSWSRS